jgi:hypothetical protein
MNERSQSLQNDPFGGINAPVSRRIVMGSSGLTVLSLLTGSAFGREEPLSEAQKKSIEEGQQRIQEMLRQSREAKRKEKLEKMAPEERAFWEQFESAGSAEEQRKIMQDWHVRRVQANLSKDLGVSPEEWAVIQPRAADVFYLQHAPTGGGDSPAALRVAQGYRELMAVLENKEAKPEEIKAKLTSLRAAKEQARRELAKAQQDLRKLMTLRQEAVLVLNGLLD